MVGAKVHRWQRSKYPMQVVCDIPLQSSRLPEDAQETNIPAPSEQGVKNDPVLSQAGDEKTVTVAQPTEDILTAGGSPTTVSESQLLMSPPSIKHNHWLPSGEVVGATSSLPPLRESPHEARNEGTFHTTTEAFTKPYSTRLSPEGEHEEEHESTSIHVQDSDPDRTIRRPLRRTPRSRRLHEIASKPQNPASLSRESPTFLGGGEKASLSEDGESKAVPRATPWKRQAYPLASTMGGVLTQAPAQTLSEQGPGMVDGTWSTLTGESEEPSPGNASPVEQVDPVRPSTDNSANLPVSQPSENKSGKQTKNLSNQSLENHQISQTSKSWQRQGYPLQQPASFTNLRELPTPPPSPERQQEHPSKIGHAQIREINQDTKQSTAFRRAAYPLQSPASVADLKSGLEESNTAKTKGGPSSRLQENARSAKQGNPVQRHGYPMQSPASNPALRIPLVSSPSTGIDYHNEDDLSAGSLQDKGPPPNQPGEPWYRQRYPLQSAGKPWHFQPAPTTQTPEEEAEEEAKKYNESGPIYLPKNMRAVTDAKEQDRESRTIVVCLDGTGDKFDNDNSNIVHLIRALKKDDPRQVSYYQAGIGTYAAGGLSTGFTAALDMAVGSGLGLHIRDAYQFLMHSYKEGDKICIFGFSRGAYTARCLAGMIHRVGLLPPRNLEQILFAYEFYKDDTPEGWRQSKLFKQTFCIDVSVYFVGCFDSVASVGFIPRQLPLGITPTNKPRYFRHAMALDEHRAKFKLRRFLEPDLDKILMLAHSNDATNSNSSCSRPPHETNGEISQSPHLHLKFGKHFHPNVTDEEYEKITEHEGPFDTDALEVWFLGAHADVGGGAVPNEERHKLAQIPLRWMIRQAFQCNTGIIFKTKVLAEFGLDVHTLWPKYSNLSVPVHGPSPSLLEKYDNMLPPRLIRHSKLIAINKKDEHDGEPLFHFKSHTDEDWTPEQIEDFYDAMSPVNDQLVQAPGWWILEAWPVEYKVPIAPGKVERRSGMNLGRYRGVEDFEPNLHWTVQHRMEHLGYRIRVRTAPHTKWRVVA